VNSAPKSRLERVLGTIERVGNKLPDPVSLFAILIMLVMSGSWLASTLGVTAIHPGTGETISTLNLLSAAQLQKLLLEMPQTFAAFPPLGMVLVVMLGIGVADKSGLISVVLRAFVTRMPPSLLSGALVFAGIMSHVAADAGYVVLIPLGAVLFHSVGRHPLAGLCAAFAGVSAGFAANLVPVALETVLAGLSQAAARLLQPDYTVAVTANYYLLLALVPAFTIIGASARSNIKG
jgi:aminobenzoyl-glutamate transport protein